MKDGKFMVKIAEEYVDIQHRKNIHGIGVINVYYLTIRQEIRVLVVMMFHFQIKH